MTCFVHRHIRNVAGTLSSGSDVAGITLVRIDEGCGGRVEEFVEVFCGKDIHPLLVTDNFDGKYQATNPSVGNDSLRTVAHHVLYPSVNQDPQTGVDKRNQEE